MRFSYSLLLLLYFASSAYSQTQSDPISPPGDSILAGFDQNLSTLNWLGTVNKSWLSDDYSVIMNEGFHSVLIKSSPNLIRDEQDFSGRLNRRIYSDIFGFGSFESNYVNDNRQIGLNSVGASTLMGGLFYASDTDTLLAGGGNKWDRQIGINNSGFTYLVHGAGIYAPVEGSQLIPSFSLDDEQIFPRRNSDRAFNFQYMQIFTPQSKVGFQGGYSSQLRGFYFPADSTLQSTFRITNNIQERNENRATFSANILMPLYFFQLQGAARYQQRQIDFTYKYMLPSPTGNLFDTRIRTSNFNIHGDLLTEVAADTLLISLEHNERSETHTVINTPLTSPFTQQQLLNQAQLDNFGTRNTLSSQFILHIGHTSVAFTGLASLFRYDTPSPLNYDDRDELTNTGAINVSHTFSPHLIAGFGIEADMIHMVYIKSQRSANNNRNYIYRFFPAVNYSDGTVQSKNRFEVLANYTIYDYEAFSQVHSFSFRQASFLDSTNVNITSDLSLFLLANVKLYERGELYWSSFSEYPLNYFVDQTLWLSLSYTKGKFRYGAGYKYLSLIQYDYITAKSRQFTSEIRNMGPTAFISVKFSHLQLWLDGWYQISGQSLQNQAVYPNFDLTVKYFI